MCHLAALPLVFLCLLLDHKGLQDQLGLPVHKEPREHKDQLDRKEFKGHKGLQE
jgi:hypothetical protein